MKLQTFIDSLDYAVPYPTAAQGMEWNAEVSKVLTEVWMGNTPPDNMCADATSAANVVFKSTVGEAEVQRRGAEVAQRSAERKRKFLRQFSFSLSPLRSLRNLCASALSFLEERRMRMTTTARHEALWGMRWSPPC